MGSGSGDVGRGKAWWYTKCPDLFPLSSQILRYLCRPVMDLGDPGKIPYLSFQELLAVYTRSLEFLLKRRTPNSQLKEEEHIVHSVLKTTREKEASAPLPGIKCL